MDLDLHGRTAVVTGASRGIGLATARALHAEGVQVAALARTRTDLDANAPFALPLVADTADDASVRAAVAHAIAEFGRLDILVNAAARPAQTLPVSGIEDFADDTLRGEVEVKVLGYLRTIRAAAGPMKARGWGRIVNVAGLNARMSTSTVGSIRNVAVAALTKTLADELGPAGINVTAVHPGYTVTEATPDLLRAQAADQGLTPAEAERRFAAGTGIGRLVTAAEVADVITFLCSPRSVAINGDSVAVGGGQRGVAHY